MIQAVHLLPRPQEEAEKGVSGLARIDMELAELGARKEELALLCAAELAELNNLKAGCFCIC